MTIEKNAPIPVRDGLNLSANIYRPEKPGEYPVIMAFTAFGKDVFCRKNTPAGA
jgi:predicted acyl esterase